MDHYRTAASSPTRPSRLPKTEMQLNRSIATEDAFNFNPTVGTFHAIFKTIARQPFKSSLVLALRPSKISGRSSEQPTEMTG
jgi:hypothetical protein